MKRPLEQLLSDPRPAFLDGLDTSPEEARFELLDFIDAYLRIRPLPALRGASEEACEGALEEIRLFFLKDDFRELRAFRDASAEFAPWFRARAEHIARERQRRLEAERRAPPPAVSEEVEADESFSDGEVEAIRAILDRHEEPDRSILVAWLEGTPFRELHARFGNGQDLESFRVRYRHLRYSFDDAIERWPGLRDRDPRDVWREVARPEAPDPIQWQQTHESTILTNQGFRLCVWCVSTSAFPSSLGGLERLVVPDPASDERSPFGIVEQFFGEARVDLGDGRRSAAWLYGAAILPSANESFSLYGALDGEGASQARLFLGRIEDEPVLVLATDQSVTLIAVASDQESLRKRVRKRIDEWVAEGTGR